MSTTVPPTEHQFLVNLSKHLVQTALYGSPVLQQQEYDHIGIWAQRISGNCVISILPQGIYTIGIQYYGNVIKNGIELINIPYSQALKLNRANFIFLSRSEKLFHAETHFLSHFVGSSPSRGDFFFLKSDTKWAFFVHSDTLESHVINFRGQDNF